VTKFLEETLARISPPVAAKLGKVVARSFKALWTQGYDIEVSDDLGELAKFRAENAEHPDCGSPHTIFDAEHHPDDIHAKGLFLLQGSRRVGTLFRRWMPLKHPHTLAPITIRQLFEDKHIFYADASKSPADETCAADFDFANRNDIGSICFVGGAWHHPDHRRQGLFRIVDALGLVMSVTDYDSWDWMLSLVRKEDREKFGDLYPLPAWNRSVVHTRSGGQVVDCWLTSMSYREARNMALKAAE
jgi:hypothetical protein